MLDKPGRIAVADAAGNGSAMPRASQILRPGLRVLPPGVERYVVDGGGAIVIGIEAGDRVAVTDLEGRQPVELLAADTQGRIDATLLGRKSNSNASGILAALAGEDEGARTVRRGLARRKIDLATAQAVRVFSSNSPAGNRAEFREVKDEFLLQELKFR